MDEVKLIAWGVGGAGGVPTMGERRVVEETVIDCCTCGAAEKAELPAWLASITQRPAEVKVTVVLCIEQVLKPEPGSTVNTTGFPDPPPLAESW
jgi:hypothetical protein